MPIGITCADGQTTIFTYGAATAPTTPATYPFLAKSKVSGGTLTGLATSPTVTVSTGDGSGTMVVNNTAATTGQVQSYAFTYTAAGSFATGSQIELTIPSGWTAATSAPGAGQVTVTGGTCPTRTLGTVTPTSVPINVVCSNGQTVNFTYATAIAPAASGVFTFVAKSKVNGGTLTVLATSPTVTVTGNGSGDLNISPTTGTAGVAQTYTFTFTPAGPSFPTGSQLEVTIPSGWTAPQSGGGAGQVIVNAGSGGSGCSAGGRSATLGSIVGQVILVNFVCDGARAFTVSYATASTTVAAVHSFAARTKFGTAGSLQPLATGNPTATISPGAATQLRVETASNGAGTTLGPQNVSSGSGVSGYAITRDTFGNFIANVAATWSLQSKTGGVVDGDLIAAGDSKSATFTGHLVGTAVVRAVGAFTGNSGTLTVVPGAPTAVEYVSPSTADLASGSTRTFTARIRDAAGNTVTGYVGSITFSQTAGPGTTTGLPSTIPVASGTATSATITAVLVGNVTVTASSGGLSTAATSFNIVPGAPTAVEYVSPSTADLASGSTRTFTARIRDAAGNTVTGYVGSITFSQTAGPGTTTGLPSTIPVASGTATSATITAVLVGNVTVTASSGGLSTAATSFNIVPGAATHLAFGVQPSDTVASHVITPDITVRVLDAAGNLVTGDNSTIVTLAIGFNPNAGTLSGTRSRTASGGIATFDDLFIDKTGVGYTLAATDTTGGGIHPLTGATSAPFNITPRATTTTVDCVPASVDAGALTTCTASVSDPDSVGASFPDGLVTFSTDGAGVFGAPNPCNLVHDAGSTSKCSATYTPASSALGGTHHIGASYAGGDSIHAPSVATAFNLTITTSADLSISKSAPMSATAGDPAGFDYTITVHNGGPSDNTGGFTVTDVLPSGLTYEDGASTPACAEGPVGTITCTNSTGLVSGADQAFTIHVRVAANVANATILSNHATVASTGTSIRPPGTTRAIRPRRRSTPTPTSPTSRPTAPTRSSPGRT